MRNEELISQHMNFAARMATNIGRSTGRVVSDIESEAVYGLMLMGARFDSEKWRTTFKSFVVYGILSQVKRYLRTKYQQPFEELHDIHRTRDDYERAAMQDQMKEWLRRFIGRLPARDRRVIRLRYLEGFTGREVAEMLSISQGRVFQIETRGLGRLRQSLARRGIRKVADVL